VPKCRANLAREPIQDDVMSQSLREAAAMFQAGKFADAKRRCSSLVKVQPESVDAHYLMGLICERTAEYEEAVTSFNQVLELNPKHIEALVNVGGILTTLNRPDEAIDPLRKALKMDRDIFPARYNLARALNMTGDLKRAGIEANKAWALNPEASEVQFLIGEIYSAAEESHKAIDGFRKCLEKNPDHMPAHLGLARNLHLVGEFEEASVHISRALELAPDSPRLHLYLCNGKRPPEDEEKSLSVFLGALESDTIEDNRKVNMHFAAAAILDRQKNYDEAFEHYRKANDIRSNEFPFEKGSGDRFHKDSIQIYTPEFFEIRKEWGSESDKPVFIVGMPRSGTTLTEQTLAKHPDIFGLGEVESFQYLAKDAPDDTSFVENFAGLDRTNVLGAANQYLLAMPIPAHGVRHAVNKLPGNYMHLGVIATLFPNAKIIHCNRNVMDSAFSCYQQNFKAGNLRFATDLDGLAETVQNYLEIMEHYRKVLPMEIFELDYEAMVTDTEHWTNALYEFVGVDPAKIDGAEPREVQVVKTASIWQVRQPVYATSIEKWRSYEKHLGGLAKKLGFEALGSS
jgi:tetratricopeptide (TPR) repeat protein